MRKAILLTGFLSASLCFSQDYPLWFLHQGELSWPNSAVGYVTASSYRDSAITYAIREAATTYVKQQRVKISGSRTFWATEGGTFWMGSDVKEEYDTSAAERLLLSPVDTIITCGTIFVLVAPGGYVPSRYKGMVLSLADKTAPAWLETPPFDSKNYYAVGMAPRYFYEKSSWDEAELVARRNLACSVHIKVKSLEKATLTEGQELRSEEVSVTLKDYRVIARWLERDKGLFYVLVSMPVE